MTGATALAAARRVADAVLYEGYLLYPYRSSSSKNQMRWQFGMVGPVGAEAAGAGEPPTVAVDALLEPLSDDATVDIHLRFLHTQWRSVERCSSAAASGFEPVDELRTDGVNWVSWHEAVEEEIVVSGLRLDDLRAGVPVGIAVPGREQAEAVYDGGRVVGRLVRTRWPLRGQLTVAPSPSGPSGLVELSIRMSNLADWQPESSESRATQRDLAARQSFVGTHLLLVARGGRFISLVDPPAWAADAAADCRNERCWPVLAGDEGEDAQASVILLCSPIILGDHPKIAPESPGQLFDSAEIDEILTLRIMTLTDEEKAAARGTDPRAAEIIDRTDDMPPEIFERLHGALRGLNSPVAEPVSPSALSPDFEREIPWFGEGADAAVCPETEAVMIGGVSVTRGDRVRLAPRRDADAQDMFLAGLIAVVRRIDLDVDGTHHLAVLLEDDPAIELHEWHGRYYYFGTDEVEVLSTTSGSSS